jgi:periplasmic protein TonB
MSRLLSRAAADHATSRVWHLSFPIHDKDTHCRLARPAATGALGLATAEQRDMRRLVGPSPGLKLAAAVSLLAHAAVLVTAMLFLPSRTEPPAVLPESSIALVFAPAPDAQPPAADATSPVVDNAAPAPVEKTEETPATEPTASPDSAPLPAVPLQAVPAQAQDTQPVPNESPPPVQKRPPRQPAARARSTPASPPSDAPPNPAAPAERQTAASGSAGTNVTAALIPPRPVAGMETNRAPTYPEIARRRGEEGRVMLRVSVSVDGTPLDVEVSGSSGHSSLDAAALSAVRQWRFIPATQAGRALPALAEVPIRFHLNN